MAITDEIPADLLTVVLPVAVCVVLVILTVAIVFWLGSNRQRSFEEAKAQASRQADEVLKEKESQSSPRATKKGRRTRRQKKSEQGEEYLEDIPLIKDEGQPRKSILKTPVTGNTASLKEGTPERSPRSKVGFQLETPPKEDMKTSRTSPPTPHPNKLQQGPVFTAQAQRTVQPLFEEPEEEESTTSGTLVAPVKKKTHPQTAVPSSGKPAQKKPRFKGKQPLQGLDAVEALPASRISDIVVSSSLSDEDIQQLMDVLLEKMNTNAEWQEASVRPENVKTLKKQNQELQDKYKESQMTVLAHSNKIKELRAEIQNEKMRHQSVENTLQGKITAQSNELSITRTKATCLEEELKQVKEQSSADQTEKLEGEIARLKKSLADLESTATSQKASLDAQAKQVTELQDTNSSMKADIQRAKSSLTNEPKLQARVSELESLVSHMEQEKQQLTVSLEEMSRDNSKLAAELQSLSPVCEESESLKQLVSSLETDNDKLRGELEVARQSNSSTLQAKDESVQSETERSSAAEEVKRVREELNTQHRSEVEGLRETITRLESSHGDRQKEVEELRAQVDRCSSLEEQLKTVSQQLQQEQGSTKDLQSELETLRASAISGTGNGPVNVPDVGGGGEELAKALEEKDELKEQVKELEKKLDDLKMKNNNLRDSCWKAKDKAAEVEKDCEQKLRAARIEMEQRCKSVRTATLTEAQEEQQTFLKQLFPAIKVDTEEFSKWMDEFEVKVEEQLTEYRDQICSLQEEVNDLRENEHGTSQEEAEQIRKTLEITRSILEKLQSEVTKQQQNSAEKDVMIDRERSSNRKLQEELRIEKDTSVRLQEQLENIQKRETEAVDSGRDGGSRLSEVEERLKETERERDSYKDEIGKLRTSIDQEIEAKTKAQQQVEDREKELQCLNEQVASETEQRQAFESKCQGLEGEVNSLKKELAASQDMVENMKSSNRELNATTNSLSPTHKSKAES